MRVLLVEDEQSLRNVLIHTLKKEGYEVDAFEDGRTGCEFGLTGQYDIVILDITLPNMDGFEIVSSMRDNNVSTPVILLTAKSSVENRVRGLDCGADDYLPKPFAMEELLARLRALSRRHGEMLPGTPSFGDITLAAYNLVCRGNSVHLGKKECAIMRLLIIENGQVVSKDQILSSVWGPGSEVADNNVEVYISFLRKKLAFLDSNVEILSVWRAGYHLEVRKNAEKAAH